VALTPQDIVRKEFREAFRGYNQTDVDLFLDEVVEELTKLSDENQKMRVRLAALQQELGRFRDARSSSATRQMASRYAELAPEEPRAREEQRPPVEPPRSEPRIEPLGANEPVRQEPFRGQPPRDPWPRTEPAPPASPPAAPTQNPPRVPDPFGSRQERPPTPAPASPPPPVAPPVSGPQPGSADEGKTEPHRPVTERWKPPEEQGNFWDRER
jgi:DivIVA domain-containing protein